jgi:hypothetical protein
MVTHQRINCLLRVSASLLAFLPNARRHHWHPLNSSLLSFDSVIDSVILGIHHLALYIIVDI